MTTSGGGETMQTRVMTSVERLIRGDADDAFDSLSNDEIIRIAVSYLSSTIREEYHDGMWWE
ncbi:MAG: hypothetical protein M3275_12235 [Thermoproteota archaeon]|nr:hypothetical protein [Thermoproteota archaeon]